MGPMLNRPIIHVTLVHFPVPAVAPPPYVSLASSLITTTTLHASSPVPTSPSPTIPSAPLARPLASPALSPTPHVPPASHPSITITTPVCWGVPRELTMYLGLVRPALHRVAHAVIFLSARDALDRCFLLIVSVSPHALLVLSPIQSPIPATVALQIVLLVKAQPAIAQLARQTFSIIRIHVRSAVLLTFST